MRLTGFWFEARKRKDAMCVRLGLIFDLLGAVMVALSGSLGLEAGFGGPIVWISEPWRIVWLLGWFFIILGTGLQWPGSSRHSKNVIRQSETKENSMIETRIHHIDPNFPEESNDILVEVKFFVPTEAEHYRDGKVAVCVENYRNMTVDEICQAAIKKAQEFLKEILTQPA
jgi:hypothetical protein